MNAALAEAVRDMLRLAIAIGLITTTMTACASASPRQTDGLVCRANAVIESIRNDRQGRVLVTAHRGVHDIVPENSIASIRRAIELDIDIVELDIRVTRDGVPVLMHDETVDRTTSTNGVLDEFLLDDLQAMRLLGPDGSQTDEAVPTLADALAAAGGDVAVLIDLKSTDIDAIAPVVASSPYSEAVFFFDSETDVLNRVTTALPSAIVLPIAASASEALELISEHDLQLIHLREDFASVELSDQIDALDSAGYINALGEIDAKTMDGDIAALAKLVGTRPDVVSTDAPVLVQDYLRGQGIAFEPSLTKPCQARLSASFSYQDIPTYGAPEPLALTARETQRWDAVEARQGAAASDGSIYAIVNHVIGRYDRQTGELQARWVGPRGGLIRHLNSCFVEGEDLLCANSNHPEVPMASSIERFDAVTLDHLSSKSLGIMDEGSLVWFDHYQDGWIVGFAHYNDETGLPFKSNAYAGVYVFDAAWRKTGGWMLPSELVELMAPQAASGGAIGPDGLLYVMGHDRKEMYVLGKPTMGPKLIHVATIAIDAEGQAFAFGPDDDRIVYAISRPNAQVRAFQLPVISAEALAVFDVESFN